MAYLNNHSIVPNSIQTAFRDQVNEVGRTMFRHIADEELDHYERLNQLHEKWEKREKWPETVPLKVKDTIVKDVLKDAIREVEGEPENEDDDLKAIRTAIDFEEKGS